jgi:hypothetical protein
MNLVSSSSGKLSLVPDNSGGSSGTPSLDLEGLGDSSDSLGESSGSLGDSSDTLGDSSDILGDFFGDRSLDTVCLGGGGAGSGDVDAIVLASLYGVFRVWS